MEIGVINKIAGIIIHRQLVKIKLPAIGNPTQLLVGVMRLIAGLGILGMVEVILHVLIMELFMVLIAYGMEILQGMLQMDGVTKILLQQAVQTKQLKKTAWILFIAGGNIQTGIILLQEELAMNQEVLEGQQQIQQS